MKFDVVTVRATKSMAMADRREVEGGWYSITAKRADTKTIFYN